MTINELVQAIAKREGHKSQSRIGDIREIIAILSDMSYDSHDCISSIIKNGIKRANKRKNQKLKNEA